MAQVREYSEKLKESMDAIIAGIEELEAAIEAYNNISPLKLRLNIDIKSEPGSVDADGAVQHYEHFFETLSHTTIESKLPKRLSICGECGNFFVSSRKSQIWCSRKCGDRVRARRAYQKTKDGILKGNWQE